ncbi:hypothetical protein [Streptomyces termitum]|uniref:hypothetical protein n=1 Tax=Streptomyces termitum TaxID=67368 RepID=UPI0033A8FFF8
MNSTPTGGFARQDVVDALVDEILGRRLLSEEARHQDRRLRQNQAGPRTGRNDLALRIGAEVEEGVLLLVLSLLLGDCDTAVAEAYLQEPVQRRHFPAAGSAETEQIVFSQEALVLKPN